MEKRLKDHTVAEFMDVLAWPGGAPGGGSMCALAGALGASGLVLVAKLTANLKRFAHEVPLCQEVAAAAEPLMRSLTEGIDRDTDCYNLIVAAYKLPKDSDEEKAARKAAIADATLKATQAPYQVLCESAEVLRLCARLEGHYNPVAASDFAAAVLQLRAAAKTAWHNVLANLGGLSDPERAEELRVSGSALHAEAMDISGRLIDSAEGLLTEE